MDQAHKKLAIKIKQKKLYDEYVLTTKHIICKFKYLMLCFDFPGSNSPSGGLVNIKSERLKELLVEQSIIFDSNKESGNMCTVVNNLKKWHPSISRVEIDCNDVYTADNLHDYPICWNQYEAYFKSMKHNNCILNERDFDVFKKCGQIIVDVKVYFRLVKKIDNVSDYHVNFLYLQKLLAQDLIILNWDNNPYLDEVRVNMDQLPFAGQLNYTCDDDDDTGEICYVYPYVYLIPLYPVE